MRSDQAKEIEFTRSAGQEISDEIYLARRASGDLEAFAELYQRHMPYVYHYHLARTGNADDAQDLTSQTFLAALEGIASYRGQGSFGGWLFGIAAHKVADHYRRLRSVAPLEDAEYLPALDPPPDDIASQRLELAQISSALKTLSAEQAEALTLRIFGNLSAAEVGQIMGRSEAAAKMLVHRGLRSLRQALDPGLEVLS
jgi:RNA polymerase sigma-70 factor (ECF subfamily)